MEQDVILSRLLDKYENSKHLTDPGSSNRRVMLRVDKDELPEYQRDSAAVRDRFNQAARELEQEGLVRLEWIYGQPVFSKVILELERAERAYERIGRRHPRQAALEIYAAILEALSDVSTAWVAGWRDDVCQKLLDEWKLPAICKKGPDFLSGFLRILVCYDRLDGEPVTVRTFSIRCFQNSKRFEREFQEDFLRAAERYDTDLKNLCAQREMSGRDKLACLGIYAHPELYLLSGKCSVVTDSGSVDLRPLYPAGAGIPSTAVDMVRTFSLDGIKRITFLENKTNYEEYLLSELAPDELAVYHGGFLSPQKRVLLKKLADSADCSVEVSFWADIDLGGFLMFEQLQKIFPQLQPMRMDRSDVEKFFCLGFDRTESYLDELRAALEQNRFPLFRGAIEAILKHKVTIEQEVFLSGISESK